MNETMYIFISENEIVAYNGEPLKRYVGNRLIKIITNPTEQDLLEFGYMYLIISEAPSYDPDTQYLVTKYRVVDGHIETFYEIHDIPINEEAEE